MEVLALELKIPNSPTTRQRKKKEKKLAFLENIVSAWH